jgi:hypothetical protein
MVWKGFHLLGVLPGLKRGSVDVVQWFACNIYATQGNAMVDLNAWVELIAMVNCNCMQLAAM